MTANILSNDLDELVHHHLLRKNHRDKRFYQKAVDMFGEYASNEALLRASETLRMLDPQYQAAWEQLCKDEAAFKTTFHLFGRDEIVQQKLFEQAPFAY